MSRNTYYQDELITQKFNKNQFFRILKYVIPYKKTFIFVGALMCVAIGLSLLPALYLRYIVDNIIPNNNYKALYIVIGIFFVTGLIDITIQFFQGRIMAKTGHTIIYEIRNDIFSKLQQLSFDYFDNRPTGKIIIRVTSYVDELADFFSNTLLNFIVNLMKLVIVLVFLFALNYILAFVVLSIIIPMSIFIFFLRTKIKKLFKIVKNKDSNLAAFLHENILGVSVIKTYNRNETNQKIYKNIYDESLKKWRNLFFLNELFGPGVEGIWNIGNLMIYVVSFYLITTGKNIQVGTVIAFSNYLGMFAGPLNQIAAILQQFTAVSSNLERIFDTIDTKPLTYDKKDAIVLPAIKGNIKFDNVTFTYDGAINILENFNLFVPAGKTVALVGPTGAGKTTVVNLISRFYDATEGKILIDDFNVKDVKIKSLRSQMGIMMQDSFIFKGTIFSNIKYAKENATNEECIEAAKKIFADEFISKLPNGYFTEISERGDELSAGEKQLLSFARVILCNPKILILDEATSNIDTNTEQKIQKALEILFKDRTSFIIAHRLSTIKKADCILYIANKGIAEAGTHEDLMKNKGLYYNLNNNNGAILIHSNN